MIHAQGEGQNCEFWRFIISWGSATAVGVLMLTIRALPVLARALPMLTIACDRGAIPFGKKVSAID